MCLNTLGFSLGVYSNISITCFLLESIPSIFWVLFLHLVTIYKAFWIKMWALSFFLSPDLWIHLYLNFQIIRQCCWNAGATSKRVVSSFSIGFDSLSLSLFRPFPWAYFSWYSSSPHYLSSCLSGFLPSIPPCNGFWHCHSTCFILSRRSLCCVVQYFA